MNLAQICDYKIQNNSTTITFCNVMHACICSFASFMYITFTCMHLADAFIQSDLQCIQAIHLFCQYMQRNACVCNVLNLYVKQLECMHMQL